MSRTEHRPFRIWLLSVLPAGLLLHPFEWFVSVLCMFVGVTTIFKQVESTALESALPEGLYRTWGVILIIGGFALLVGVMSIKSNGTKQYVIRRVAAYKLGLRLLGISTIVYIACLMWWGGFSVAATPSVLPLAFVLTCGIKLVFLGDTK